MLLHLHAGSLANGQTPILAMDHSGRPDRLGGSFLADQCWNPDPCVGLELYLGDRGGDFCRLAMAAGEMDAPGDPRRSCKRASYKRTSRKLVSACFQCYPLV